MKNQSANPYQLRTTQLAARSVSVVVLVLALAVLAACGAGTTSSDTAPAPAEEPTSAPVSANEQGAAPANTNTTTLDVSGIAYESTILDNSGAALTKGEIAPDFSFTFEDGSTYKLSDFRGKKVMLNFWATWCPPCNAEMPDIQDAAVEYQDEGFLVLAVSQDIEIEGIAPFAERLNLTIPLIADADNEIGARYGARNLPMSVFINTDGTINAGVVGMVDGERIKQHIDAMR